MILRILKEISPVIREMTTTTFTSEEDLLFIDFLVEVDQILSDSNLKITEMIRKYKIVLDENGIPLEGEIDKFKPVYDLFLQSKIEFETKFEFETIRKLKNENALSARIFKLLIDDVKK